MYLLRVWHKPQLRYNFPIDWKVPTKDPLQVCTIIKDGKGWYDQLQHNEAVTRMELVDLNTNDVLNFIAPLVRRKWWLGE